MDVRGPDTDAVEYEMLEEEQLDPVAVHYALDVLDRYRNLLGLTGRDY